MVSLLTVLKVALLVWAICAPINIMVYKLMSGHPFSKRTQQDDREAMLMLGLFGPIGTIILIIAIFAR